MWVIGQTIVLGVVIVASAMRSRERITRLEAVCAHIEANSEKQSSELRDVRRQVGGMSRHVEQLEAIHKLCPYTNGAKHHNN